MNEQEILEELKSFLDMTELDRDANFVQAIQGICDFYGDNKRQLITTLNENQRLKDQLKHYRNPLNLKEITDMITKLQYYFNICEIPLQSSLATMQAGINTLTILGDKLKEIF